MIADIKESIDVFEQFQAHGISQSRGPKSTWKMG